MARVNILKQVKTTPIDIDIDMDEKRSLLKHFLAALAYRTQKVCVTRLRTLQPFEQLQESGHLMS